MLLVLSHSGIVNILVCNKYTGDDLDTEKIEITSPNGGDPRTVTGEEEWVVAPTDGEVTLELSWLDDNENLRRVSLSLSPNVDSVEVDVANWENPGVFFDGSTVRIHFSAIL